MPDKKKRQPDFDPRSRDRRLVLRSAAALGGSGSPQSFAQAGKSGNSVEALKGRLMGFMLPHEQFTAPELIELGISAEQSGFDLLATSDHFQPWQANERHAGAAWITMAALAQRTKRVWIGPTGDLPHVPLQPWSRCASILDDFITNAEAHFPGNRFTGSPSTTCRRCIVDSGIKRTVVSKSCSILGSHRKRQEMATRRLS
jgi:Luciferase-like monooxygenase